MGLGGAIEPLVVVTLLFGGTWVNRTRSSTKQTRQPYHGGKREDSVVALESGASSPTSEAEGLLAQPFSDLSPADGWRRREFRILGWKKEVQTPDTQVFEDRLLSRLLFKLPFLVEVWYWALVYWVRADSKPAIRAIAG